MLRFFTYNSPYRTGNFMELSLLQVVIPFVILGGLIGLLIVYRDTIRNSEDVQNRIRVIGGSVFAGVYASHYLLRFAIYGFDTIVLPFQLCGISMFFAIILIATKKQSLYAFVLYTGVIGGLISLFTPVIGYNFLYYRYYQFYIGHILLILTPLYFMIIEGYYPSKKDTWIALGVLQMIAVFMGVFNYYTNSDFMFILVDPAKIEKFPIIRHFGGIPYYLMFVELAALLAFYISYRIMCFIHRVSVKKVEYKKV